MHRKKVTVLSVFTVLFSVICRSRGKYLPSDFYFHAGFCGSCYATDADPYHSYATISLYSVQRHLIPIFGIPETGCEPVFLNLVSRHSTRLPEDEEMSGIRKNIPRLLKEIQESCNEGRCEICNADVQRLREAELNFTDESMALQLSPNGAKHAAKLGKTYKHKFPEILDKQYDPIRFKFQSSGTERTIDTAFSIAKGIFGQESSQVSLKVDNRTLHFYNLCDDYQDLCNVTLRDTDESERFQNGHVMTSLIERVSRRLGIPVTYDDVTAMYDACRYGYDLEDDDAWCAVFSREDLKILEYGIDLKYYWRDGYGSDINQKSGCIFADSLINALRSAANGKEKSALIQVTHAEEIKNLVVMFGLFRDPVPLTSENMWGHTFRQWRTSVISPFLGNLAFALYRCKNHRHKVLTLHNERPVVVGGCRSPFCDLADFERSYGPLAKSCSLRRLCCPCCSAQ